MIAKMQQENEKQLYNEYMAMSLYAISNNRKMSKTLTEIKKTTLKPKEIRSGKEVAEAAAAKMGIKINWEK